jgi:hypothetical protein
MTPDRGQRRLYLLYLSDDPEISGLVIDLLLFYSCSESSWCKQDVDVPEAPESPTFTIGSVTKVLILSLSCNILLVL